MVNRKELKAILKETNIHFFSYWNKKRSLDSVNKHNLLPKKTLEKEKSKDPKYDRLKKIMQNPRIVSLEDIETDEIKTFPSIFKAPKFIDRSPMTVRYWGLRNGFGKNKYKVAIQ